MACGLQGIPQEEAMRDSTPKTMWACGEADDTDKQQAVHLTWLIILKSLFEMRTGTAVAAVRGTQWRGEVTPLKRWAEQRVSRLFRATEPL